MTVLLTLITGITAIIISRLLFTKWFNHLSLYTFLWMWMIALYELRLMFFYDLTSETWGVVLSSYFLFVAGIFTVFISRTSLNKENKIPEEKNFPVKIFDDHINIIKYIIIVLSIIGILSALQHWMVLINKYGSLAEVLLNAYFVYKERTEGELKGVIPYIGLVVNPAILLVGAYSAYKNKISILSLLPIIAVILKETANLSRAGLLFGFFEFIASFLLFRHLLIQRKSKNQLMKERKKIILGLAIIFIFVVSAAGAVKTLRNVSDTWKGTSSSLAKFEGAAFISPSIYFYAASQVGVLNAFLKSDKEKFQFGGNTLFTMYSALEKFNLVERPPYHNVGYYIPIWTNTGTYLRDLYNDFGPIGVLLIPYILGLVTTVFWFRFYFYRNFIYLIILVHLYIAIGMSFFVWVVRSPNWTIGLLFTLILFSLLNKLKSRKLETG